MIVKVHTMGNKKSKLKHTQVFLIVGVIIVVVVVVVVVVGGGGVTVLFIDLIALLRRHCPSDRDHNTPMESLATKKKNTINKKQTYSRYSGLVGGFKCFSKTIFYEARCT